MIKIKLSQLDPKLNIRTQLRNALCTITIRPWEQRDIMRERTIPPLLNS